MVGLWFITKGDTMPFKSEKQRRFMHSQKPEIADKWEKEDKKANPKKPAPKKATPKKADPKKRAK